MDRGRAERARTLRRGPGPGAIEAAAGYALFQGTPTRGELNPMGSIHGGWIGSILDSALGCAVLSSLPAGQVYSTTGLDIRYRKFLTLKIDA